MSEPVIGALTCVGAGQMATALIKGWLGAGMVHPSGVTAVDILPERRQSIQAELGVRALESVESGVRGAQVVLVAVKPQQVSEVLPQIRTGLGPGALVISIAAGIRLSYLEQALGAEAAVIRVMPNTPCLVAFSASGMSAGRHATPAHVDLALGLFRAVGEAYVLPESLLDAVTGLSGSGPAYVYLVIEALADGGISAGLPRDVALPLAAQTVLGAAKMVLETGQHPAVLRQQVTSPAGTTAAGLLQLERGAVRWRLMQAVLDATARSAELGAAGSKDAPGASRPGRG